MKKMKEHFLNSSINFLQKYNSYSDKEVMRLRYGLEGLYLTLTKLFIILGIAFIIGILKEVIFVLIFFNIIRYFGFGFHAEKSFQCLVLSAISIIGIPYLFLKLQLSLTYNIIICFVAIIIFTMFAPADTIKRPLRDKKKRLIRKILTVATAIVYLMLIIIFNDSYFSSLVISSLVIEVIFINPLTYKLFKQPYNNYKKVN